MKITYNILLVFKSILFENVGMFVHMHCDRHTDTQTRSFFTLGQSFLSERKALVIGPDPARIFLTGGERGWERY